MRMRPVQALPLAPGKPLTMRPGGYHIMLMELKQPLRRGESFPLTLTFEHAAPVTVQVPVVASSASGPMQHRFSRQRQTHPVPDFPSTPSEK